MATRSSSHYSLNVTVLLLSAVSCARATANTQGTKALQYLNVVSTVAVFNTSTLGSQHSRLFYFGAVTFVALGRGAIRSTCKSQVCTNNAQELRNCPG